MKDYYRILEIHPEASLEVMNKAYRALVQKYHPDLYHLSDKVLMQERMKDINEAYEILSNAHTRKDYDQRYAKAFQTAPSAIPTGPVGMQQLKKMLIWGVLTFFALKFLMPVLANPALRIVVLGLVVIVAFRMFVAQRGTR